MSAGVGLGSGAGLQAISVTVGPAFTGLADVQANVAHYWGVIAAAAGYTGHALTIERDSDNAQLVVDCLSTGQINTSAAVAFTGAATSSVVRYWDNIGSLHLDVAAGLHVLFFNQLGSLPAVRMVSNGIALSSSAISVTAPFSLIGALKRTVNGDNLSAGLSIGTAGADVMVGFSGNDTATASGNGTADVAGMTENEWHILQGVIGGTLVTLSSDGSSNSHSDNVTAVTNQKVSIFGMGGGQYKLTGDMAVCAIVEANVIANFAAIDANLRSNLGL